MSLVPNTPFIFLIVSYLLAQSCDGIVTRAKKAQLASQGLSADDEEHSSLVIRYRPKLRHWQSELGTAEDEAILLRQQDLDPIITTGESGPGFTCTWANPLACVIDGVSSAAGAILGPVLRAIGVIPDEKPAALGGPSVEESNLFFLAIVTGMLLCIGIGKLVDTRYPNFCANGRPPVWVFAWFAASYALLVPGIICILFSFNIWTRFTVYGHFLVRYNLTRMHGHASAISDSMINFIQTLWHSGGRVGAILVITYAMVIPLIKILLLFLGEYWRNSSDKDGIARSRRCLYIVQVVSKWACPDMFAYILMLYLFRNMNHPPRMLATADLDLGFISFATFCLSSTFASLAISLPKLPGLSSPRIKSASDSSESTPRSERILGRTGVMVVAFLLAAGFFTCWSLGIFWPCMSVKLELSKMHIPESIKNILRNLDFEKLINAEVSLWKCLLALAGYLSQGEVAIIIAFVLIGGFVMILPFVDVLLLMITAFTYQPVYILNPSPTSPSEDDMIKRSPPWSMKISYFISHISMLDVFAMGIVVICAAGSSYSSKGIFILMGYGMYPLIIAEVLHYLLYYFVSGLCAEDEQ